ncbi:unnamed protein product, partial [Trichogramma brassicae]
MSLHYYPQATYRYRSAAQQQQHLHREQLHQQQQYGSDSDGNDYSEYDNGDEEEADNGDEEEDEDEEDDEDEDGELDDDPDLPYEGFVPVALKYLHQTTRPRNCEANPDERRTHFLKREKKSSAHRINWRAACSRLFFSRAKQRRACHRNLRFVLTSLRSSLYKSSAGIAREISEMFVCTAAVRLVESREKEKKRSSKLSSFVSIQISSGCMACSTTVGNDVPHATRQCLCTENFEIVLQKLPCTCASERVAYWRGCDDHRTRLATGRERGTCGAAAIGRARSSDGSANLSLRIFKAINTRQCAAAYARFCLHVKISPTQSLLYTHSNRCSELTKITRDPQSKANNFYSWNFNNSWKIYHFTSQACSRCNYTRPQCRRTLVMRACIHIHTRTPACSLRREKYKRICFTETHRARRKMRNLPSAARVCEPGAHQSYFYNTWFERVSMMVILLNCITLGMYQPCVDDQCETNRCKILQMFDDIIFAFFALEMTIKMVAMGIYGKGTYLADSWNRLDFFIVIAGALEYCLNVENMNLSAIRTIRVLRPLRAINRIPSMRILVMLLLDTLPMLGNVLLLCFFVFFIFGIVGVQLWEGILRQRCFLKPHPNVKYPDDLEKFFEYQGQDYICSRMDDNGMHSCSNLPRLKIGNIECNETALPNSNLTFLNATSCVNWNAYYTECKGQGNNPFQGTISFDNIGLAWVAIFLVISLEGWTDIMYYVQDAHSFWDWIYFVLLIVIGSFFMINLCLVVIATQFSETKKREMERMRLERARFHSTSTLASSTNTSEPTSCYAEIVKYIAHLWRRGKRRLLKKYRLFMISRRHQRDQNLLRDPSQSRRKIVKSTRLLDGKLHHSRCPRLLAAREAEQLHQSNGVANNNNNINNNNNNNGTAASATDLADPSGGSGTIVVSPVGSAPRASPEVSEVELPINNHNHHHHHHHHQHQQQQQQQHRHTSLSNGSDNNINVLNETNNALLSPPSAPQRRRSSVMFSEVILLHGSSVNTLPGSIGTVTGERNICSSEKMTQTGDGNVWAMTSQPNNIQAEIGGGEAMTCQELLAFSGALSAALPTGQVALDTFLNSLTKGMSERHVTVEERSQWTAAAEADACSCCCDMQNDPQWPEEDETAAETSQRCLRWKQSKFRRFLVASGNIFVCTCCCLRRWTKKLVNHKYFQQGILLAILINTLSMGIEYHNQPDELTFIVEISNIVFSAIFAVEMLLKVIAEGPFGYISNGFNVFDGVVVVLRSIIKCTENDWCQLFILAEFIGIVVYNRSRPCTCAEVVSRHPLCRCDRKHFNDIVWALVTVFQDQKNSWQSCENVHKYKGNNHQCHEKYAMVQQAWRAQPPFDVAKCNLTKEIVVGKKNSVGGPQPPIITHTAATPQDSPNTTLDTHAYRDLSFRAAYPPALSIESIDRSSVSYFLELLSLDPQLTYTAAYHWTEELSRRTSLRGFESLATRKILPVEEVPLSSPAHTINNLSHHEMTTGALPSVKPRYSEEETELNLRNGELTSTHSNELGTGGDSQTGSVEKIKKIFMFFEPKGCLKERDDYSLYIFPPNNRFRELCHWFVEQKWFDNVVLLFIGLNCITLAMERPNIPPDSKERIFLASANYVFTAVFAVEMFVKVVATGMLYGTNAYFTSGWNIMDGSLVVISIIDLGMSLLSSSSPRIFGILRVFRLLRSLRPLRVINRAPGLKLVVQTLLSSLRPIGNIVLICCTFFVIFGILGVQLFKGAFYYCDGPDIKNVRNKTDCLSDSRNVWLNRKYNFDDLGKALMSLFVLSSRDGWVNIMYTGLDAVGVDQQPIENYSEWRLLYFISFILLVGFFVLNMFVGVVVENFHRCREEQEKEERVRRAAKRALQMEKKRRKMHEPPYYNDYCKSRLFVHNVVTSKYFDLAIAAVIGLNVVTMALEFYMMPKALTYALKIFNYFFTAVFILESAMKLLALGLHLYLKDKWNQLDIGIVILSVVGIVLEEVESKIIPINPTIIRVMRVLRIARVLKLLKMAKGIRALLDTVMQALPQVGNLGLLFFLLFFIFAALGVELFGRLECSDEYPCQGLGEHAHFSNFGMAFLTLFRVATGDNWNGIMKDTLRDNCDDAADCVKNCCVSNIIAPIFFVIFVLMAQFVLVNVVVAVLMKHLEESHKQMEDELDMENQLERELAAEQEELLEEVEEEDEPEDVDELMKKKDRSDVLDEKDEMELNEADGSDEFSGSGRPGLSKVRSLPSNFTYNPPAEREKTTDDAAVSTMDDSRHSIYQRAASSKPAKFKVKRRQTFHSQDREPPGGGGGVGGSQSSMHFEVAELIRKPNSNLSVPRIIPQRGGGGGGSTNSSNASIPAAVGSTKYLAVDNKSSYLRPSSVESFQQRRGSNQSTTSDSLGSSKQKHFLCPVADVSLAKARIPTPELASSSTSLVLTGASRSSSMSSHGAGGGLVVPNARRDGRESDSRTEPYATSSPISMLVEEPVDVQSIINERRPSRLKPVAASPLAGYGLYVKEEDEEEEEKNEQSARGSAAIGQPTNSGRSSGSGVELCIFVDGSAASPEQREQETQVGDAGEERSVSSDKS